MARKAKAAKSRPTAGAKKVAKLKKNAPKMNVMAAGGRGAHDSYCIDIPGEPGQQMCCVWSEADKQYLCSVRPKIA
jgi:hypothetical protein